MIAFLPHQKYISHTLGLGPESP